MTGRLPSELLNWEESERLPMQTRKANAGVSDASAGRKIDGDDFVLRRAIKISRAVKTQAAWLAEFSNAVRRKHAQ